MIKTTGPCVLFDMPPAIPDRPRGKYLCSAAPISRDDHHPVPQCKNKAKAALITTTWIQIAQTIIFHHPTLTPLAPRRNRGFMSLPTLPDICPP